MLSRSLLVAAVATCVVVHRPIPFLAESRSMIDGSWVPATAHMGGQPFPEPVLKTMRLTVSGTDYVVSVGGGLDKGTIAIDSTTSPMSMTVTGVEGPNAGKRFPAIFELVDGRLRICYDLSGQARPTAFASAAGSMHFLVDYQRVAE
jgi:uncharacterized protein (TIGR03067 family)